MRFRLDLLLPLMMTMVTTPVVAADLELRQRAENALDRAVDFYRQQVASHGGYVYRYSSDLKKREGEGKTDIHTLWVQPPGTPAVGLAYLDAFERTRHPVLLEAASATGECLIQGQLRSGGWQDRVEFAPEARAKLAYRVDPLRRRGRNLTSFDDDKTQSALRFLMRLDRALEFKDERVHEAIAFALDRVVQAQFPNGGWAQVYDSFPEPDKFPVRPASFPNDWPRTYPGGDYWRHYTLNDNAIADTIEALLLAARVYDEPRYRDAAVKAGGFLLLAQLPEPQPAWAQQYDVQMHPAWARKFEPPAVSGGESQGVIRILLDLYVETADKRFLDPVTRAIKYLQASKLPDGQLARFYELQTNKPLYMTKRYELTFSDSDLPTHYGFKVSSKLDELAREQAALAGLDPQELAKRRTSRFQVGRGRPSEKDVEAIIAALDERGAWVEEGRLRYHGSGDDTRQVIDSGTFIRNLNLLSKYLDTRDR
ncbi:MAG: hypothetical protein JSS49_01840 [Planctomycetes bacterium]|nr:hypothetical protein [Planctomycetota bacterium]